MRRAGFRVLSLLFCGTMVLPALFAAEPSQLPPRKLWTTSKIQGSPEPPPPYVTAVAFPKLKFDEPLCLAAAPGLDRWFVSERFGKIFSFPNKSDTSEKKLLIDIGRPIYGLAFHPQFERNGYFFVTSIVGTDSEGTRISRYTVNKDDRLTADPASEKTILSWPMGGHNGGCIKFGPDGFLYISTGDGSGIADELQTGQDLTDLLGAMLRIDVDHPADGKAYGIPADNPFIKTPGARPEIFAYGIRQMWKFGFDRRGTLWAGEVGQDLWEAVHHVIKGGNYGWSVQESAHPFRPERPKGPTPIVPAIVEHNHNDFRSITGGNVYEGSRLPELKGMYIYSDYDTGRTWGLRYDFENRKVTEHRELADGVIRIVEWGQDAAGEMVLLDHIGGQVMQLVKAERKPAAPFPRKLSETGLFASTKDLKPAEGLIPYAVNSELWSDGATKQRYLAVPGDAKIEFNAIEYPQPAPGAPRGWRFPDKTVAVKTFSIDLEQGNPASRRRLETRILVFEQTPGTQEMGDQVWQGYTYVWNDDQTDAELLDKGGLDRKFEIKDASAPGGKREQVWHFPSRAECTTCHTLPAKFVLGLNTLQLNRDYDYDGVKVNQLAALEKWGLFHDPLPEAPADLPRLVDYRDAGQSLEARARAYLHSNCSHCHMKWGGGNAEFQLLATLPLAETGTVNVKPGQGGFGLKSPALLVPGHPEQSLIAHRMQLTGLGRMPHIASKLVDEPAVKLIEDWIRSLDQPAK